MSKKTSPDKISGESTVLLEVPLGQLRPGEYVSRHVEVRLDRAQADVLYRILAGLREQSPTARLASGKFIQTKVDVVRWLLEQVGDAA